MAAATGGRDSAASGIGPSKDTNFIGNPGCAKAGTHSIGPGAGGSFKGRHTSDGDSSILHHCASIAFGGRHAVSRFGSFSDRATRNSSDNLGGRDANGFGTFVGLGCQRRSTNSFGTHSHSDSPPSKRNSVRLGDGRDTIDRPYNVVRLSCGHDAINCPCGAVRLGYARCSVHHDLLRSGVKLSDAKLRRYSLRARGCPTLQRHERNARGR